MAVSVRVLSSDLDCWFTDEGNRIDALKEEGLTHWVIACRVFGDNGHEKALRAGWIRVYHNPFDNSLNIELSKRDARRRPLRALLRFIRSEPEFSHYVLDLGCEFRTVPHKCEANGVLSKLTNLCRF